MFVGRANEILKIITFLKNKGALLIYGLRRVGKTTLIKRVLDKHNYKYVYFQCVKADEETNVKLFVNLLTTKINFPDAEFKTFLSVFQQLNKFYKDYVFVIDEYSFLKQYYLESKRHDSKDKVIWLDSEFQNIIDNHLDNINLILSGSSINVMKQLLEYKSPLYGRFNSIINLHQFTYLEAKDILKGMSNNDVVSFYSVFGGSPYVLSKIDIHKSLKENIKELLLTEDSVLKNHLNNNVINELDNDPDLHPVLDSIKNGIKKYGQIQQKCNIKTSGLLDKKIKKLLELNIIESKYLIGKEGDRTKKYYQIKDNLLKFYYAYIHNQENIINLLGIDQFYNKHIEPSIKGFISLRFENIVRDYFSILTQKGLRKDIVNIGSCFTPNHEFDCVLEFENNSFGVYEAKYYTKPIDDNEIAKEINQIKEIKGLDIQEIGSVSSSGYKSKKPGIKYLELSDIFFGKK